MFLLENNSRILLGYGEHFWSICAIFHWLLIALWPIQFHLYYCLFSDKLSIVIRLLFIGGHIVCHRYIDSKIFPDTTEPTEILHYAYLNATIFPIVFPTETAVMCYYRKLNRVYSYGYLVPSECWFWFHDFFGIDNVVVPLIFGFFVTSNELHQKLRIMALVTR